MLNSNYSKRKTFFISFLTLCFLVFNINFGFATESEKKSLTLDEAKEIVLKLYNTRNESFITGNLINLKTVFDTSQKYGKWGLEHEVSRVKYLKDWSKARGIKFTSVTSEIIAKNLKNKGNLISISIDESYKFDYIYESDTTPTTNSFGIGVRHHVSLINKNNSWVIYTDWYTDGFTDALKNYSGDIKEDIYVSNVETRVPSYGEPTPLKGKRYYNREKAVEYANKYCGLAWGNSNNNKYNQKYTNYAPKGGDCTNFASQILTDKEAGGMKYDSRWNPNGPPTWVNADAFCHYIVNSGRGYIVRKGNFEQIIKPYKEKTGGAIDGIHPGDLVGYEKAGDIIHFSIFTDRDSHGYPLVNCHTTDRYKVPWDLGWADEDIKFIIIHVNG